MLVFHDPKFTGCHPMKPLPLADCLDPDRTVVLCATVRLSTALRQQQSRGMVCHGQSQCRTLQALTVNQWFDQLHEQILLRGLAEAPTLQSVVLSTAQERIVWEQVIRQNLGEQAQYLFDVSALAKTAMQAHELAVVWEVHPQPQYLTEESRQFLLWQKDFEKTCQQKGWVDSHNRNRALIESLPRCMAAMQWPKQLAFAGFSRYNPLEQQLQTVLQSHGVEICAVEGSHQLQYQPVQVYSYPDSASEVLAAALWARDLLASSPQARLAIVVPDLAGMRHLLQDTLEDVLMPALISPSQAESPRPFNLSLGLPLAQYPLVHAALQVLQCLASFQAVEQTLMSQLLRSPYWSAADSEGATRSLIEAAMRKRLAPTAPLQRYLSDWRWQVTRPKGQGLQAPNLLRHMQACIDHLPSLKNARMPSEWAHAMLSVLQDAGWLYARKLSSHEYQAKKAFLDILDQLGSFDDCLSTVSYQQALSELRRLCWDRTFQPQTEGQPRLQVLGLLETSGLAFDAVWVMGMVDGAWPPPARPNPLLPSDEQRKAQCPNASATIQLAFAQGLQSQLLQSSQAIVFSWPRTQEASELSPSPLIPPTSEACNLAAPDFVHWTREAVRESRFMLAPAIEDAQAPPVTAGEHVTGGTSMLRAQAICPAWAYYQYRLGAGKLEEPLEGLDSRQRGTFLHEALRYFWQAIKSSDQLRALTSSDRQQAVEQAVDIALSVHGQDPKKQPLKPRLRQLERDRLCRLIHGWLEVEAKREQPFVVLHTEKETKPDIEGLQVRMSVDRIDQLDDGSLLVIDYKTGAAIDTKNWSSDRLTEPQLPIYASIVASPEGPVEGVVFAKVLLKEPGWAGLSHHDKVLPKVLGLDSKAARKLFPQDRFPDWKSVVDHWNKCVRAVAREVQAGEAGVRFQDDKALRYCDVMPLLRLAERQTQWEAAVAAAFEPVVSHAQSLAESPSQ